MPSTAGFPLTVTRPPRIQLSASRREPSPSCDSTFCSRSAGLTAGMRSLLVGIVARRGEQTRAAERSGTELVRLTRVSVAGFLVELLADAGGCRRAQDGRVVRLPGDLQIELRIELPERVQLAQRRQLVQAPESEVLEEFARGPEQLRPAGQVAMTDHADPQALEQCLGDVGIDRDAAHR